MVNWSCIDHVFLDMDGTLLDLHFDNYFWLEYVPRCYADRRGLSLEVARESLYRRYRAAEGTLQWYCVDHWSRELDLDIPSLKRDVSHKIAVQPAVEHFLTAARRSGKRLVLLTNAHSKSVELKLEKTGLSPYLCRVITSHDLGLPKEDSRFWGVLREHEPFDPDRTLFVDDNLEVLRSAATARIAFLLAVTDPDSQAGPRDTAEFNAITCFDELLPVVPSAPKGISVN